MQRGILDVRGSGWQYESREEAMAVLEPILGVWMLLVLLLALCVARDLWVG